DMLFKPGALPKMNGCIPNCVIEGCASANAGFFKRFLDQTAICAEVLIKVGTVTEIHYKEFVGRIARFNKTFQRFDDGLAAGQHRLGVVYDKPDGGSGVALRRRSCRLCVLSCHGREQQNGNDGSATE